jgi:DNA polymerase (family 10)
VRRCNEVVRDLVLVLVAEVAPAEVFRRLSRFPGVHEFAGQDERRLTLRFAGGASAQIVVTSPVNAGTVLVQATGSEAHLHALAARAGDRGFALTGAALWRGSEFVPTPDEESFYAALGLPFIPPELREGRGEVDAGAAHALPRLLQRQDLKGFLHCHTTYSDGTNSVEELARACQAAGYQYIGITDHSQTAAYAGGLTPDDLLRQADEIDAVNERLDGIRVLKGVEADILQDGRVDYEPRVLERLDFVIASVHSRFNMSEREMTARMLAAMDNPYLTIIGHPTGRLLLSRDPYGVDLDAVSEKAAATGVALEINADPHRLDLDWRVLRRVREAGAGVSIGADAHNAAGIHNVDYGVAMARKGWLGPDDVLNAQPLERFLASAARRRG